MYRYDSFVLTSLTELNTGRFRCVWPPFPGEIPPTTLVPYSIAFCEWKVPWDHTKLKKFSFATYYEHVNTCNEMDLLEIYMHITIRYTIKHTTNLLSSKSLADNLGVFIYSQIASGCLIAGVSSAGYGPRRNWNTRTWCTCFVSIASRNNHRYRRT